jgi:hypothetical protein
LIPFLTCFEEISKNQGIFFLSLDPTESHLQLFHHGVVIGKSWKKLVSILGLDTDVKPLQIVQKSIRDIKAKSYSSEEFALGLESLESFEQMKNPKVELY